MLKKVQQSADAWREDGYEVVVLTLYAHPVPEDSESAEVERLYRALSFAASAIKSGEGWTPTCDEIIGDALNRELDR